MAPRVLVSVTLTAALTFPVASSSAAAQDTVPSPAQQSNTSGVNEQVQPINPTPTYTVNVVQRTTKAVDYRDRGGSTEVGMRGTQIMPSVNGTAKVTGKTGRLAIDMSLHHLQAARTFGPEYLTYVAWAITPEGRPVNLGEVIPNDDGNADLQVTTALQSFGLIVTAEPYFAVTRPSNTVVAENSVEDHPVKGFVRTIDAKFDLLRRGEYIGNINPAQLPATYANVKEVPLQLLEARNAVYIANQDGAQQYAPDTLRKAQDLLSQAEDYYRRKQGTTPIGTVARAATQAAEDARLLAVDRKEQAQAEQARNALQQQAQNAQTQAQAASEQARLAQLEAQQAADRRARAEAEREAAERTAAEAERARQVAQQQAQQALQQSQQTQQQLQASVQQQQQLAQEAQQARLQAQQVQQQAQQQRERLLLQLNQVLQTKDTARGLVANMPDVLFDLNKATLKQSAKIRLAKVAGIIMAYPDLKLEIDGYTDSTGTPEHNEVLSEQRAASVRDFLTSQGASPNAVTARGLGQSDPIASNATTKGRQLNRRVELVVSGTAIGQNIGTSPGNAGTTGGVTGAASASPGVQAPAVGGNASTSVGSNASGTVGGTATAPSGTTAPTPTAPAGIAPTTPPATPPQPSTTPPPPQ